MTRKEAENYIYQSYQRASKLQEYASKDSEKRNPQYSFDIIRSLHSAPSIVVTGSKGKGSVANMIATTLGCFFHVGLMTSPHIIDFCERFQIDGINISDEEFCEHIGKIRPFFDYQDSIIPQEHCISPMGIQTALALSFFSSHKTDFNIFECGKGARYDDVNNVLHEYAVINTIFLEHTRELGDTVEMIARDKSCIITGNERCIYVAPQKESAMKIILERASLLGVPVKCYGKDFNASNIKYTKQGMLFDVTIGEDTYSNVSVPLLGEHQALNCALALAICKDIIENTHCIQSNNSRYQKPANFDIEAIKPRLDSIKWAGRMEILSSSPFVLLDACINKESCRSVKEVLKHLKIDDFTVIIGIPDDKDFAGVALSMSAASNMIMTKSQNAHYVFTEEKQIETLQNIGIKALWSNSISSAFQRALSLKTAIVALGTTSFISEVKQLNF